MINSRDDEAKKYLMLNMIEGAAHGVGRLELDGFRSEARQELSCQPKLSPAKPQSWRSAVLLREIGCMYQVKRQSTMMGK